MSAAVVAKFTTTENSAILLKFSVVPVPPHESLPYSLTCRYRLFSIILINMNYERFTIKAQEALNEASAIAQKEDHAQLETEHLLLALLRQQDGMGMQRAPVTVGVTIV